MNDNRCSPNYVVHLEDKSLKVGLTLSVHVVSQEYLARFQVLIHWLMLNKK